MRPLAPIHGTAQEENTNASDTSASDTSASESTASDFADGTPSSCIMWSRGIRPRLKHGTFVISREESSYVGKVDSGIEIFSPVRSALASLEGYLTCEEIAEFHHLDLADMYELLSALDDAHLLDTHATKIAVHSRFHSSNSHRASYSSDDTNDGAYQQLQTKLAPELTFTTWLPSVRDGGVSAIGDRRNTTIEIYGDSRIAVMSFGILLSSRVNSPPVHLTV